MEKRSRVLSEVQALAGEAEDARDPPEGQLAHDKGLRSRNRVKFINCARLIRHEPSSMSFFELVCFVLFVWFTLKLFKLSFYSCSRQKSESEFEEMTAMS